MCDEWTAEDNAVYLAKQAKISRRGFGLLSGGVALASGLNACAGPDVGDTIISRDVDIKTPDGTANAVFSYPKSGSSAAVLVWPDIMGLRPSFRGIGERLAREGYSSLVVNPYYRQTRERVFQDGDSWGDEAVRKRIFPYARALTPQTNVTDAKAFTAWLDDQKPVDTSRKIGTSGYCMGGPIVFRTAAALPERIGAAASFHGGGLVRDTPDSPHLGIPKSRAAYLIAIAQNDDERDPEAKTVLRESFDAAGLEAEIEVYADAMHGWCPPDSAVYNHDQAEKAWARMLALFEKSLA